MNINKNIKDGIFFLLVGIGLGVYSAMFYLKSFNKDIAQSPYLFPVVIAIFFIILSCSLIYQGIKADRIQKTGVQKNTFDFKGVIVILVFSAIYYAILKIHPLPYITFGFVYFDITIANFEIATLLYIFAMMFFMGVRKVPVLILVPVITPIVLSIIFRTFLNVLLP